MQACHKASTLLCRHVHIQACHHASISIWQLLQSATSSIGNLFIKKLLYLTNFSFGNFFICQLLHFATFSFIRQARGIFSISRTLLCNTPHWFRDLISPNTMHSFGLFYMKEWYLLKLVSLRFADKVTGTTHYLHLIQIFPKWTFHRGARGALEIRGWGPGARVWGLGPRFNKLTKKWLNAFYFHLLRSPPLDR